MENKTKDENIVFTKSQENAIDGLIGFINSNFTPTDYIAGLTGQPGTGKTFIVKYIIQKCKYADSVIKCASTTHKACRVFSSAIGNKAVDTIQSTFGFRLDLRLEDFNPDRPQFNPMAKPKLDNVRLLIIDEASMLPAKLVTFICNACKNRQIKVIFVGDNNQLPPVNESASIAFRRCNNRLYTLVEIVRQEDDNPITELISLVKDDIDNKGYKFISYLTSHCNTMNYNENGDGFVICGVNDFVSSINNHFLNSDYRSNIELYKIIAYTNVRVNSWNKYIRKLIIPDSEKSIITKDDLLMSYQTIVDDFLSPVILNSEEYIVKDIADYCDSTYGFKGFMIKLQAVHGGKVTQPILVIDSTDNYTMLKYNKTVENMVNTAKSTAGEMRSSLWKKYYKFKSKFLLLDDIKSQYTGKILYNKDIDYGFAITSHKSQGTTYNIVFVDLNDMLYDRNGNPYTNYNEVLRRIYVACSRAKNELILCYGR